jgi:xylulose-5-phosphate/fructose-6-phosphate phosphoketolase
MMDQYIKFVKVARNVHFRKDTPALNVILSSLLERQDHNGFSHQNPSYISNALDRDLDIVNVYFPADKNLAKLAMEKSLASKNAFNISVIGKKLTRT